MTDSILFFILGAFFGAAIGITVTVFATRRCTCGVMDE